MSEFMEHKTEWIDDTRKKSKEINMIPIADGLQLLYQGARALARVEASGIRVDVPYLDSAILDVDLKIIGLQRELKESKVFTGWKKRFGDKTNIQSRTQLGIILTEVLGINLPKTASGRPSTDEDALSAVDYSFVKAYLNLEKMKKCKNTYLMGIRREVVGGFIHPFFNLHTVQTYRSSSDSPNFQNIPVRDPVVSGLVRRAIIPRPGHRIVEVDFGGIEVRIAACYCQDPSLIAYIKNPSKDMHRDMAAQCYCIPPAEVTKELRYAAKNQFVFPQFYGDYYGSCAQPLWESMLGKKTVSGGSVKKWLRRERGIRELGDKDVLSSDSFMAHIKQVQEDFWGRRFRVYGKWRRDWVRMYEQTGELRLLTGFVCRGLRKKNEIMNYPIQGSAFHCLLWSLIRVVLVELKRRRLKSLIIGQIHDSLVGDVPEDEVDQFKQMVTEVMTEILPQEWKWIIVPLVVEITTYSRSWAEKDED